MLISPRIFKLILSISGIFSFGLAVADLPVDIAPVTYQTVIKDRSFDAVIEAVRQSTVSAQTSGRIIEINFDVDDYVTQGDVLLRFTDREQRARLDEAKARFTEAQKEYARVKGAYDKEALPKAALDKATADLQAARSRAREAREQFEHTVVKAPFSGIVRERHVEMGETANLGQSLMTGLSLDELRATAEIPQSVINRVRAYGKARIVVPDQDDRSVDVSGLTIFPYAHSSTHSFKVRADLPPKQAGLFPGMFVKLVFVIGEEKRLLVPARAVVYRSEVRAVYVIDEDGTVSFRQVRIGRVLKDEEVIEVVAGLEDGERVALDPVQAGIRLKQQRRKTGP